MELGDLLDLGSTLLGGLFGQSEGSKNRKIARKGLRQAQAQFDAQMDQSVQRRVADAQAAGIHPLFAMGASVGASPTVTSNVEQPTHSGNHMGNAIREMGRILSGLPGEKAKVRKDEAEAALYEAEAAAITQAAASQGRDSAAKSVAGEGVRTFPLPDSEPLGQPTYFSPQIPKHGPNPGIVAGKVPGEVIAKLPDGREIQVYNPDLGLDEIGQVKFAYQRAIHKGADALTWLRKHGFMVKNPNLPIPEIRVKRKKRRYNFYRADQNRRYRISNRSY